MPGRRVRVDRNTFKKGQSRQVNLDSKSIVRVRGIPCKRISVDRYSLKCWSRQVYFVKGSV